MELREQVLQVLEGLRQEKKIASNQEAAVVIYCDNEETIGILNDFGLSEFASLCIVSEVVLQKDAHKTLIAADKSSHIKCQRCWNFWPSVGANTNYPDLCERCAELVQKVRA
jgi:isoleucyl-tRNA synthetase